MKPGSITLCRPQPIHCLMWTFVPQGWTRRAWFFVEIQNTNHLSKFFHNFYVLLFYHLEFFVNTSSIVIDSPHVED